MFPNKLPSGTEEQDRAIERAQPRSMAPMTTWQTCRAAAPSTRRRRAGHAIRPPNSGGTPRARARSSADTNVKVQPSGYPDTNASGNTINRAYGVGRLHGEGPNSLECVIPVECDGCRLHDGGTDDWHEVFLHSNWPDNLAAL